MLSFFCKKINRKVPKERTLIFYDKNFTKNKNFYLSAFALADAEHATYQIHIDKKYATFENDYLKVPFLKTSTPLLMKRFLAKKT